MIERRQPTHVLTIRVPLNLDANPAAESWDIQEALAQAIRVLLPVISLGTLGLRCGDFQVDLVQGGRMSVDRRALGPPIAGRRVDITACEWRIGAAGLEELRIVERAFPAGVRYAVKWLSYTANKNGQWELEPIPSDRDDEYLARCRFDNWEDAYQLAIRMPLDSTGVRV